ncbi:hypothetical protein pipiens_007874 [Culex pipiens pipiens]|uniref:Uncharacterized protein n=1 Tax=Culex pipiens pipiens TaxID=38569 RepID=A0ABD1DK03_CULPP
MESTKAPYNDARFEEIKKEVSSYIKTNGFVEPSTKMARLTARTCLRLWSILTRPTDKPLHLPLKDVNKIGGTGTSPTDTTQCWNAKEKVFRRSGKSTEDYRKSIKSDDDTIVFLVPPKPLW